MGSVRRQRRNVVELGRVTIGDWVVLIASLLTVASLFMPWFISNVPGSHDQWAFTYSEAASVIVIVFFLAILFLVAYPSLSPNLGLPPLPFSTPVIYLVMGALLLLLFVYELGKYACIQCQGVTRGFGVYVGLIASAVFIFGAIVRWGSRPPRRTQS